MFSDEICPLLDYKFSFTAIISISVKGIIQHWKKIEKPDFIDKSDTSTKSCDNSHISMIHLHFQIATTYMFGDSRIDLFQGDKYTMMLSWM